MLNWKDTIISLIVKLHENEWIFSSGANVKV